MILRRRNVTCAPAAFSFPFTPCFHRKKKHLLQRSVIFFIIDGYLSV